ncbi:MAG: hypothetical protein CMJ48_02395 [Planctomycetaceae bacterium]|nr:hypothetical protein [Planctomycetaceae bacterium]
MSDDPTQELNESASPDDPLPARRSRRPIALGLLTAFLFSAACVLWGMAPATPEGPLTAHRSADSGYDVEGRISSGGLSAQLTSLTANKSSTTSTGSSSSDGSRLMAGSIAVFNLSDHALMQRVGLDLFKKLQETARFEEIHYLPHDEQLPAGSRLPDVFVTLDLPAIDQGGVPLRRTLDAQLRITVSDRYGRSNYSYRGTFTPPTVTYFSETNVDYKATNIGIETSAARYHAVSLDLAAEIDKGITKLLDGFAEKHPVAIESPPEFSPPYAPPPEWSFLNELEAQRLVSGCSFMRRTVAVWSFAVSKTSQHDVYRRITDELEREGWKIPEAAAEELMLRIPRGQQTVEVFRQQSSGAAAQNAKNDASIPQTYFVVFTDSMTPRQIDEALQALLDREAPESVLVQFADVWFNSKPRVLEYFKQHPPQLMTSLMHVARWQLADGRRDEAQRSALRAHALQRIARPHSGISSTLKELAEEVGIDKLPDLPDPSVFEAIGVIDLRNGNPVTRTVDLGETMILLVDQDQDSQKFVKVTPIRNSTATPNYALQKADTELRRGGGSSSSSGTLVGGAADGTVSIHVSSGSSRKVHSRRIGESDRFELTVEP